MVKIKKLVHKPKFTPSKTVESIKRLEEIRRIICLDKLNLFSDRKIGLYFDSLYNIVEAKKIKNKFIIFIKSKLIKQIY
jgi:hypothetical protein